MKKISRNTLFVIMFIMIYLVPIYGDIGTFTDDGAWCWFADPRGFYHNGTNDAPILDGLRDLATLWYLSMTIGYINTAFQQHVTALNPMIVIIPP